MKIGRLTIKFQSPIIVSLKETWEIEVENYVIHGQMLCAIKLYKEKTGKGLKESKDIIDNMREQILKKGKK